MNKMIPNKFLAVLVIISIVISVVGVFNVLRGPRVITGHATNVTTQTGIASLIVTGNLVITLFNDTINLGDLEIDDNTNSEVVNDYFEARNDGSIDMDVSVYCDSGNCDLWDTAATPTSLYQIKCNSTTDGGATCNSTAYNQVPGGVGTALTLIQNLGNTAGQRTFKAGVNVTVPLLEDAGTKTAGVIFLATQAI